MNTHTFDELAIRGRIKEAASLEAGLSPEIATDVAFHMTDWLGDLEAYLDFCRNPRAFSPAQVNELLSKFLVHAPNHLAAAAKLYADFPVSDVFGVGAIRGGGGNAG